MQSSTKKPLVTRYKERNARSIDKNSPCIICTGNTLSGGSVCDSSLS